MSNDVPPKHNHHPHFVTCPARGCPWHGRALWPLQRVCPACRGALIAIQTTSAA